MPVWADVPPVPAPTTEVVCCTARLAPHVAFITVNVSSPNTPGLRDLQGEAFLDDLLARCIERRDVIEAERARERSSCENCRSATAPPQPTKSARWRAFACIAAM